jgi:hypothetical protein
MKEKHTFFSASLSDESLATSDFNVEREEELELEEGCRSVLVGDVSSEVRLGTIKVLGIARDDEEGSLGEDEEEEEEVETDKKADEGVLDDDDNNEMFKGEKS